MNEFLQGLLDIKKVPASILMILAIICSLLLFTPVEFLNRLALLEFKQEYNKFLGITLLVCLGLLISMIIKWVISLVVKRKNNIKWKRSVLVVIDNLDWEEIKVLREFTIKNANTINVPIDDPIVAGLIQKAIILQVGELGTRTIHGMLFPFRINDSIKKYITYQLLRIPNRNLSEEETRVILNERPKWARDIDARNQFWR